MKLITPYKTKHGALKSLDNGGKFYNIFTTPDDGVISRSEVARVAGVSSPAKAFLFLEIALSGLSESERVSILQRLGPKLTNAREKHAIQNYTIRTFRQSCKPGKCAIVSGYPSFLEDKTQFQAMIMIPIMIGKVMTMMPVPIMDRFDVYQLYQNESHTGPHSIIATVRGSKRLPNRRAIFAGLSKKLNFKTKAKKPHDVMLEASFYCYLD
ncbi:MAG: hypothetical protein GY869_23155 [Planctomycetes bacterium]|nr:hypothetical protein [Planctomycetota bacterium]